MPTDDDRKQLQFDYAWNWFDFHAKQRTSMFNFYIVVIGATLGAIAALTKTNVDKQVIDYLCYFGIVVSVIFCLLDARNSRLLRYGELNLVQLEKIHIFPDGDARVYYEGKQRPLGVLLQEYFRNGPADANTRGYYDKPYFVFSHSFLMPASFVVVIVLLCSFLLFAKW